MHLPVTPRGTVMRTRLVAALAFALALLFAAPAPAQAAQTARVQPGSNWYGWNWDHIVTVYDGTKSTRWDVAGAVQKWSVQGLRVVLTRDPVFADVTVTTGDMQTLCGSGLDSIIGCGSTTVVAGEPVHGTVVMNEDYATWIYSGPLIGGTLHELGHVLGFGHPAGLTNADSVMGTPIPANNTARTTLSSFDRGGVRLAYKGLYR